MMMYDIMIYALRIVVNGIAYSGLVQKVSTLSCNVFG